MGAEIVHHDEAVMGTVVSFDLYPSSLPREAEILGLARARATLQRIDAVFSTYREFSPVSRLRRGELTVNEAPPEVREVLALCERVRELSDGWFDAWAMPGGVDPTGLVKGWAAERAIGDLVGAGVTVASVNAGGDIATVGLPDGIHPWRFGIQDPFRPDRLSAIANVFRAIATSGTYARGAHLFDPHARRSVTAVVSATVVGEDLAVADGLATALSVAGSALFGALERAGYLGFVILGTGERVAMDDFPFAEDAAESGSVVC